jgi:hypothetical protein
LSKVDIIIFAEWESLEDFHTWSWTLINNGIGTRKDNIPTKSMSTARTLLKDASQSIPHSASPAPSTHVAMLLLCQRLNHGPGMTIFFRVTVCKLPFAEYWASKWG